MEILSSRTILRPRDYTTTLSFYRDILGLATAREYPGGTVFFAGQGLIEVAAHGGTGESSSFDGALWLQVRDLTAVQTELVLAGVKIDREARQEPWGLFEMWIADPDGIPIVLVQIPEDHPIRRDSRPKGEN
ncbi:MULTISPECIES: VOC family protein [Rhodococcus]|uniref:VOC family protein n=1 Tax=Rhodococcus jostii TaxID=132919 RepID=A0ABU4CKU1_RHOJO|nr:MULTISPECIES: VOC family protein [Rhodococcus]MDH6286753.1 catechol 2,3-dioxygenase-like lactoylglutathione lyase family enzyme [Rhodococcus opacus]MDI9950732.1 VOC family protein [Rhodococcus sp. IEGM 1305]MDV6284159.1 VOC family protein [Rhodococcus jostii]